MAKKKDPADYDPVKKLADAFHDAHVARFGCKPDPRLWGRFGKEVKALVGAWGEPEVAGLVALFFETTDARVQRSDYSQTSFCALVSHLRLLGRRGPTDARTLGNVDAASRAMGRV